MPVIVNNTEITDEQVFGEMQYHPASSLERAQYQAALALTIRELLCQEARRLGITSPDNSDDPELITDYLISTLIEKEVVTPEPTEEECERYYHSNPKLFRDHEGNPAPFHAVRESVAEFLKECSERKAIQQYIRILAGRSRIAGISLDEAMSPLVN